MNTLAHLNKLARVAWVGGLLCLAPLCSAVNYNSGDLLLVFRSPGFSDVEFNIGPVNSYLSLTAGAEKSVGFDVSAVKANFNNGLTNVTYLLMAATALNSAEPRVWLTDAYPSTVPNEFTLSKFSQIRSKLSTVGQQAAILTQSNSLPAVIPTGQPGSFTYIASDANLSPAGSLGGLTGFPIEAVTTATLKLYEFGISTAKPAPPAAFIGTFLLNEAGSLTFTSGGGLSSPSLADILVEDTDGFIGYWSMDSASLAQSGLLDPDSVDPAWRLVSYADFDGDGNPDLVFQHADGRLGLWFMQGTKMTVPLYLEPASSGPDWQLVGVRDIDSDGKPDLIFQHKDGSLAAWLMDGTKMRSASYLEPKAPGDAAWKVVGTADTTGNGQWQLVFEHTDGTIAFWTMNGLRLASGCYSQHKPDASWRVLAVADLDQDGKSDLLFQNVNDESLAVWFMNGCTLKQSAFLDPRYTFGTWKIVGPR